MAEKKHSPRTDELRQDTHQVAHRNAPDAVPALSADAPTEAIVLSHGQPGDQALATIPDSSIIDAVPVPTGRAALTLRTPKGSEVKNHRELAEAIFAECDPVKIGRELLESGDDKGASVRARIFETLANWQFGKKTDAAAAPTRTRPRIIWTIPGPPREGGPPADPRDDPQEEND